MPSMRVPSRGLRLPLAALRLAAGALAGYAGMLLLMALLALPLESVVSRAFPRLGGDEAPLPSYGAPTMCLAGVVAAWVFAKLLGRSALVGIGFGAGAAVVVLSTLLLPLWIPASRYQGPLGREISESLAAWSVAAGVTAIIAIPTAGALVRRAKRGPRP
jgi:hypothetical protein